MRPRAGLVVGLVVAVAVLVGAVLLRLQDPSGGAHPVGGLVIGRADAPHHVVVYEDLLCPYCRQFEDVTREELPRLADAGKVQVEYRPFNLLSPTIGNYSLRAANAFAVVRAAAGDQVAKQFHDVLYLHQPSEDDALGFSDAQVDALLVGFAVQAGAQESDVRAGIESLAQADWVAGATAQAQLDGVQGTPAVFLDGRRFETGETVEEVATNLLAALD